MTKVPNCLITGRAVYQYFTFKGKHYTFCCTGCVSSVVSKVANKDPAVKKIIMSSKDVKNFTKVELSAEQKKQLKTALSTKKKKKKKSGKGSSKKKSGKGSSKKKKKKKSGKGSSKK